MPSTFRVIAGRPLSLSSQPGGRVYPSAPVPVNGRQGGAQPFDRGGVELRDAGLVHMQDLPDALHAQFLLIVKLNHRAVPAREPGHGADEIRTRFLVLALDFRIVPDSSQQSPQSGPLRHSLEVREVRSDID